jgi:hypothetical protein
MGQRATVQHLPSVQTKANQAFASTLLQVADKVRGFVFTVVVLIDNNLEQDVPSL